MVSDLGSRETLYFMSGSFNQYIPRIVEVDSSKYIEYNEYIWFTTFILRDWCW